MVNTEAKLSIPVVSFIGNSNSGKTTLVEQIVSELKKLRYRVATVKHAAHGFDIDRPGKDSYRLQEAGADLVIVSSPTQLALVEQTDADARLPEIVNLIGNKVDIILLEGYKNGSTPRIAVVGNVKEWTVCAQDGNTLGMVLARPSPQGKPHFAEKDIANIINLLVDHIRDASVQIFHDDPKVTQTEARCGGDQRLRLDQLLAESAVVHGHICPGQVLGVRMAMHGLQELGIENPKAEAKRLIVYVEIDRCATDAIHVATGCKLGKRTMKHVDYGKLAATFVDLRTSSAVRIVAREDARDKASRYSVPALTKQEVEVAAYKAMTDEELFHVEPVKVNIPIEDMPGPPLRRVICDQCGEGVNDFREVEVEGKVLCRACAYGSYYECQDASEKEYAISNPYRQTEIIGNKTA
ncbi:MAG: molybdopterin-guanine dinucleotide biosynthesis protein B [Candidatus Thorarchaeota archaeon]|jgi:formylmethanofuran dehydrogenase subunit E